MQTGSLGRQRKRISTIVIYISVIAFLIVLPRLGLSIYAMHILIGVFIWIIVASSLRLLDLSGQGSIGHAAFMAIGAYTSGILAKFLELVTVDHHADRGLGHNRGCLPGGGTFHAGEGDLLHDGEPVLWHRRVGGQSGF